MTFCRALERPPKASLPQMAGKDVGAANSLQRGHEGECGSAYWPDRCILLRVLKTEAPTCFIHLRPFQLDDSLRAGNGKREEAKVRLRDRWVLDVFVNRRERLHLFRRGTIQPNWFPTSAALRCGGPTRRSCSDRCCCRLRSMKRTSMIRSCCSRRHTHHNHRSGYSDPACRTVGCGADERWPLLVQCI